MLQLMVSFMLSSYTVDYRNHLNHIQWQHWSTLTLNFKQREVVLTALWKTWDLYRPHTPHITREPVDIALRVKLFYKYCKRFGHVVSQCNVKRRPGNYFVDQILMHSNSLFLLVSLSYHGSTGLEYCLWRVFPYVLFLLERLVLKHFIFCFVYRLGSGVSLRKKFNETGIMIASDYICWIFFLNPWKYTTFH